MNWAKLQDVVREFRNQDKLISINIDMRDLHCYIGRVEDITETDLSLYNEMPYEVNKVLETIYKVLLQEWSWIKNCKFKYVRLSINTETKMCCIYDRHGNLSTLDDLKLQ